MRTLRHRLLAVGFVSSFLWVACGDDPIPPRIEPPLVVDSADALVGALEHAYRERDLDVLARVLANDPDNNAVYAFLLSAPDSTGAVSWTRDEELRVHRRMLRPHEAEPEPPHQLWLTAISVVFTAVTPWEENRDVYRSESNPDGLPPEKWKAVRARFSTFVFLDTQTDHDFLVEAEAILIVIEDLEKHGAAPGRFLLYHWQDIDGVWAGIKEPFR